MGYTPHVLVVGGGVLGTGIARDFAIRGLEVTLIEQGTLAAGTTGSMHGLLYSGARFVEDDPVGALRCRQENRVLREIADHCIEETDGIMLPAVDDDFDSFVAACEERSISTTSLSGKELESNGIAGAFDRGVRVPDAVVDPFALTLANAESARTYGAEIKTGAAVVDLLEDGGQITGAEIEYDPSPASTRAPTEPPEREFPAEDDVDQDEAGGEKGEADSGQGGEANGDQGEDSASSDGEDEEGETADESGEKEMPGEVQRSFPGVSDDDPERGEREEIEADFVVNAAGAWADHVAALGDIELPLSRRRGRMLVLAGEQSETAITRRTDSGDPVTITPYQGNSIVGPIRVEAGEDPVSGALAEVESVLPAAESAEILRSYSGVWTQHGGSDGSPYGPGATLIEHGKYDDQWGLLSVVGATVTTHRYIAEKVVDRVCSEFGIDRACLTDELSLPDQSVGGEKSSPRRAIDKARATAKRAGGSDRSEPDPVLCETRSVTRDTVREALEASDSETDLRNVRMRTGATMGDCQGGRCGHRIAAELFAKHDPETVDQSLEHLLATRWQGRRKTLRRGQLAAAIGDYELHARTLARGTETPDQSDLDSFDEGAGFTIGAKSGPDADLSDGLLGTVDSPPRTEDGRTMACEAVIR